ncbi:acetone monooxygenase [Panacagrimonas perspica]|uniref:Acetone monooxygenase n=1 Tax=Panacagrimonas perspica TaxID=381431 RepID=A0A4S3K1T3_9GAMM|nr:NAD(P)/FAD-dependent oxidoreductase [Panacagrimonas perspica]TDU30936.1 acetone monooxygenase [Panacagrimonas perspica]THD01913.1 cyclohexanone monooxygenase [Panacagrimonas perspica]
MSTTTLAAPSAAANSSQGANRYDAIVIGAGVAGLYQLYRLRNLGLKVRILESGTGVGGTWYWNRYPGARFDSQAYIYQYWFSEELYKEWNPSERFPAQPETEKWLNFVADRCDLRKDIQFSTHVTKAQFDERTQRWKIDTTGGETFDAQYFVTCCGMLSAPLENSFPGQQTFKGQIFHTARWPKQPIDFRGKRVGIVGTGATGIQVIQTIAPEVGHLKVFLRTPQYIIPMQNPKYSDTDREAYKALFPYLKERLPNTFSGFDFNFKYGNFADLTPARKKELLEMFWNEGTLVLWLASFPDMFTNEAVNEEISEFVRVKMRERLKDPELCRKLIPTTYGFGTHRVPLESGYLEAYHRPNVELIEVAKNPIVSVVPEGLKLKDGTVHECDILILATGFDAGSGSLTRIDIRGKKGQSLKEQWNQEIRTTMGLAVHGYPNLFTTAAPLAPSAALCNMTTCLQQQVDWIAECIGYMHRQGLNVIEATKDFEDHWVDHHDAIANATLVTKTDSWYMGSNVDGKPRRLLSYIGGVGRYRQECNDVAAKGYEGFTLT